MLDAQSIYGDFRIRCWSEMQIALGRRLARLLPEDIYGEQPLIGAGGDYVIVADARIDNRDELADDTLEPEDDGQGGGPCAVHNSSDLASPLALQPHRSEAFKLSSDPPFVEKVRDIVGLYLSSPDRAVVLCVDEKSQVQALDRTQPLLPIRPGQVERRTDDYTRHGTTSLFAALDVQAGTVIGISMRRHRTLEFRKFLDEVERNVPADLDIHVVMDNYGTHKTKLIRDWFAKRQRWHVHFTPTSASWINLVERFFALITERAIKRGSFLSVGELEAAIHAYNRRRKRRSQAVPVDQERRRHPRLN